MDQGRDRLTYIHMYSARKLENLAAAPQQLHAPSAQWQGSSRVMSMIKPEQS